MDRPLVTTETVEQAELPQYHRTLLSPRPTPARSGSQYSVQVTDPSQLPHILASAARSKILAVDFETRGVDYSEQCTCHKDQESCKSTHIVGIGLAWDTGSVYLPYNEMPSEDTVHIIDLLTQHKGLIAHNVYFDGGVLRAETGLVETSWHACTLVLYRLLSNEGWAGIRFGLKDAMTEILQWENSNEAGIDRWLVGHGYYKGNKRIETGYHALVAEYNEGKLHPDKAEMWRVPSDILGRYCVLDAEACYLLYSEHLMPVLEKFPELKKNFHTDWMYLVNLHVWQKMIGIQMDRAGLIARERYLQEQMDALRDQFLIHPLVEHHIQEMEQEFLKPLIESEPAQFKKLKAMPKEPDRLRKDGTVSKAWTNWKIQIDSGRYTTPIESKTWQAWNERLRAATFRENPEYLFNVQSKAQLVELFYRRLGYPVRILTASEQPGTGADALAHMGDIGQILIDRDNALKEQGYIQKYLELIEGRDTIHPSFSIAGAATGRMTSRDPNLQQIKKIRAVMDLFVARPGMTWIDLDFAALEPTVTTEFSGDKNMEAIYGNGAGTNDIYLFVASTVPQWAEQLEATGYDRYRPTPEAVARAKKECKHIRKIAKVVVLACAYGAGVDKILQNLVNDGMQITREEVAEVHKSYWETFEQVKKFGYELQDKWWETVDLPAGTIEMYKDWGKSRYKRDQIPRNITGYIMNGLGRPMCVTHDYKKDILNRFVQSTGHDILVRYIRLVGEELDRRAIPWDPLIADFHDAITVEVPDRYVEDTLEVYLDALAELNKQLGGDVQLKGTPTYGKNLTAVKEPES